MLLSNARLKTYLHVSLDSPITTQRHQLFSHCRTRKQKQEEAERQQKSINFFLPLLPITAHHASKGQPLFKSFIQISSFIRTRRKVQDKIKESRIESKKPSKSSAQSEVT